MFSYGTTVYVRALFHLLFFVAAPLAVEVIENLLHPKVYVGQGVSAQLEPLGQVLHRLEPGFVVELVLQAGPHIHGNGTQLNLTGAWAVRSARGTGTRTMRCRLR